MRTPLLSLSFLLVSSTVFGQNCPTAALSPANNHFAFDVYTILNQKKGPVFYSPYSIFTALQMTADGAKGTTAAEMLQILHSTDNIECIQHDIRNTQQQYNLLQATGDSIQTANSLWVENSFPLNPSYLNQAKDMYNASIKGVNFIKSFEQSRKTINSWVGEQTEQRIKELLPGGTITSYTRLVLVNTIWLKAKWLTAFRQENTRDSTFYAPGAELTVPFMNNTLVTNYAEDENMQVIELPYSSNKLSMIVMLPAKDKEHEFSKIFNLEQATKWIGSMRQKRTQVSLPKFKLTASFTLNDVLKTLGMKTAFSDVADFSGISNQGLHISDVVHKAFIEVDEAGTEAAAATAVTVVTRSLVTPPKIEKIFNADHPFIFFLYDKENKTILFMGKIEKP
ncbi:MAG: serpin family protein [Chitinophagaceae bacterium]